MVLFATNPSYLVDYEGSSVNKVCGYEHQIPSLLDLTTGRANSFVVCDVNIAPLFLYFCNHFLFIPAPNGGAKVRMHWLSARCVIHVSENGAVT